ncbi:MAG: hypothetical protein IPO21_02890 [Bacteroidales bacterium]|nr:hypothetical protein [Bacteroidales bacterium]
MVKKKVNKKKVTAKEKMKRVHKVTAMLNDKEHDAITRYCKDYKVKNKSKFIREMVFTAILQTYERDYPTLFSKQVMADLVVEPR